VQQRTSSKRRLNRRNEWQLRKGGRPAISGVCEPVRLAVEATQAIANEGGVFKTVYTVNRFRAGNFQGQPACTCISAGAKDPVQEQVRSVLVPFSCV
jgi:hypothetical protein